MNMFWKNPAAAAAAAAGVQLSTAAVAQCHPEYQHTKKAHM
jgi:hypothetical protein